MRNNRHQFFRLLTFLLGLAMVWTSCKKEEKEYDINWIVPTVENFEPKTADIGSVVTITGKDFIKISRVTIGGVTCAIESYTENQLLVRLPRVAKAGKIEVTNVYKKSAMSAAGLSISYPATVITEWPEKIFRDQPFFLRGENVDLITSLKLADTVLTIDGSTATPEELKIVTKGLNLGAEVAITNIKTLGTTPVADSPVIPVEDVVISPPGSNPILLLDFEDGTDRYTAWTGSPMNGQEQHGINMTNIGAYPHGGGTYYQSVKVPSVPSDWTYFGEVAYGDKTGNEGWAAIDLSNFKDPHISMLVNTGANKARVMYEVYESEKFANHVDVIQTNGEWMWVSIPIGKEVTFQNWGNNGWAGENPDGVLDYSAVRYIQIGMGTGDVGTGTTWEINMDNLQITDGPVNSPNINSPALYTFWDFEDGNDPFVHGSWQTNVSSTSAINGGGHTAPQGANYLQVKATVLTEGWTWYGDLEVFGLNVDLTEVQSPHMSFWVNTEGKELTFECEIGDYNGGKWGTNFATAAIDGWQIITLNMNTAGWGNWGATTDKPDLAGLTHIKLGFNANNQSGTYNVNVDNVILTDGPYIRK